MEEGPMVDIYKLADVMPHIAADSGIYVSDRGGYTVVDYAYMSDDTFCNDMTLECRGLKFATSGEIIARPFHKFFNLYERQSITEIDWARPYMVFDKLDGSMVHPCLLDGEVRFMTRGGISSQAKEAQSHASDGVMALCAAMLAKSMTPMFEYTGPDNRIVLGYDTPQLTLLAARHINTGDYLPTDQIIAEAEHYGVPIVQSIAAPGNSVEKLENFYKQALSREGIEGYVICFDDGHRLKVKTSAYALRHKALSALGHEKNVLKWVLEGITDDIFPLLSAQHAQNLREYERSVRAGAAQKLVELETFYASHSKLERRDYAEAVKQTVDPRFQQVAFALMDGKEGLSGIERKLVWASHSAERLKQVRDVIGTEWEIEVSAELE